MPPCWSTASRSSSRKDTGGAAVSASTGAPLFLCLPPLAANPLAAAPDPATPSDPVDPAAAVAAAPALAEGSPSLAPRASPCRSQRARRHSHLAIHARGVKEAYALTLSGNVGVMPPDCPLCARGDIPEPCSSCLLRAAASETGGPSGRPNSGRACWHKSCRSAS